MTYPERPPCPSPDQWHRLTEVLKRHRCPTCKGKGTVDSAARFPGVTPPTCPGCLGGTTSWHWIHRVLEGAIS